MLYYCASDRYIINRLNQIADFEKILDSLYFGNLKQVKESKSLIESFLTQKDLIYTSAKAAVQGAFSEKHKPFISIKLQNALMGTNPYFVTAK